MVSARSVLLLCQPSRANPCRTSEGESKRQPDSWNPSPVKNQLNPLGLFPPPSPPASLRPLLPYNTCPPQPGLVRPFLVWMESAPPSVFSPNSGSDPGISSTSEIASLGIRSQLT